MTRITSFLFVFIGLMAFAFEIMMLIDAIRNPIKNKTLWIIIIVVLGASGAAIYYLFGRNKLIDSDNPINIGSIFTHQQSLKRTFNYYSSMM